MSLINIIILVILALVLLWGLNNIFLKTNIIYDKMCEASTVSTETDVTSSSKNIIAAKDIPETTASNFTLSVWFYIDNWGNDIGNEKNILFMATNHTAQTLPDFIDSTTPFSGISTYESKGPPPTSPTTIYKNINIALDKYENNLFIDIECFPDRAPDRAGTTNQPPQTIYARYKIPNVSVQKWNNLTISVDGRTLDVYLDGKLRNSFILHGLYKNFYINNAKKNIYLGTLPGGTTSNGNIGFEGFITRVRFEGDSCNPQDAYNIYKEGIDASLANSIFNKYSLKVSFLEYNKEKGSFKI
jgi:hypothetical protein